MNNDDLISRQAAIDEVKELQEEAWKYWREPTLSECDVLNRIEQLPAVQPERKKGEWIKKISKKIKDKEYIGYTPYWYCSECGTKYEPAVANTIINYCYNCGARMEVEE